MILKPSVEVSQGEKTTLLAQYEKYLTNKILTIPWCCADSPHPKLNRCGARAHNMLCTREANHKGPHVACGRWEHNYLMWSADGQVLGGSQAPRVLKQLNGKEQTK